VAHANPAASKDGHHEGGHGTGRYWVVWFILLIFTGLTVLTGRMDLGAINLPLAMLIASIKATLVVLFFMHMSEAAGANRLVFCVSLIFVAVMMLGVFGDLWTRNPMTLPSAAPSTLGPEL
jgi:cytochrome c oxidase subunit IV